MKKIYYLIVISAIAGLVLCSCTNASNKGGKKSKNGKEAVETIKVKEVIEVKITPDFIENVNQYDYAESFSE